MSQLRVFYATQLRLRPERVNPLRRSVTKSSRYLVGAVLDHWDELLDARLAEPEGRAGHAQRGDHVAVGVADRGRDRGQPDLELVRRNGVPLLAHLDQLAAQPG